MKKTLIIGGGVTGLFIAYFLLKKGRNVTVIDEGGFERGCSHGNAGLIAASHIIPLASPSMVLKGLKSIFNPSSPVGMRFPPTPDLLHWAARFIRASFPDRVKPAITALNQLNCFSLSLYKEPATGNDLSFTLGKKGLLTVCRTRYSLKEEMESADLANSYGMEAKSLTAEQVHAIEPGLSENITGGVYYPNDCHLDPGELMRALVAFLKNAGATLHGNSKATSISAQGRKAVAVAVESRKETFDEVVVASGFQSGDILRSLGVKLALQPGSGYSFTVSSERRPSIPALLIDDRISVTPLPSGSVRFGGAMELGFRPGTISHRRFNRICRSIPRYYHFTGEIQVEKDQIWQGGRPCSFDGLPYIGKVPGFDNVYVATGHAMLGVTLAPATGKLMAGLILGEKTALDMHPFRINR